MFTLNSTYEACEKAKDLALSYNKKLLAQRDVQKTELQRLKSSKAKLKRSAEVWQKLAINALDRVTEISNAVTKNTKEFVPVETTGYEQLVKVHCNHISKAYDTMLEKYEYKVGEFHTEREAKEKVKSNLAKVTEDVRSLEDWKRRAVNEIYDYYIDLTAKPDSDYEDEGRRRVKKDEPNAFDFALDEIKVWQDNWCKDTDEVEDELKKENATLKAEKAALEATLKLRDEEIARLKAEITSVNTRFDALSSLATENIVSRFSGIVNGNKKRARITNELD